MYEIIPGKKQNSWQWPAVLNFFLGGTGAGLYIFAFFLGRNMLGQESIISANFLKFFSTFLVVAGLLSVATEAGRPLRGLYLFTNVKHSWMSREVLFAAVFISLSLADRIINSTIISFFSASAAVLFVISQAMILYCSFAVPAWKQRALPIFFLSSSLLNGFGLFLLLCIVNLYHVNNFYLLNINILVYGMVCICSTLVIWLWMAYASRYEKTVQSIFTTRSNRILIKDAGMGGLLPFLGLTAITLQNNSSGGPMIMLLYTLCSATILSFGYYRLHRLVSGVNYLKPVLLYRPTKIK